MFEFYDPCESCPVPLDSPKCWECKYYDPCSSCPMRCIPLPVGAMTIVLIVSNHLLTSSLIYFFGGFCNGSLVCHWYQEES